MAEKSVYDENYDGLPFAWKLWIVGLAVALLLVTAVLAVPGTPPTSPSHSILPDSNPTSDYLIITLSAPASNAQVPIGPVDFTFTIDNSSTVTECTLIYRLSPSGAEHTGETGLYTINHTFTTSGLKYWSIECTDGTLTEYSQSRILNVTSTPAVIGDRIRVAATSPADGADTRPGTIEFEFNLTNTTEVDSCRLSLNGVAQPPSTSAPSSLEIEQTIPVVGEYNWTISCTNGSLTNTTVARKLNVSTEAPLLETADIDVDAEYNPGDTVTIVGSDFFPPSQTTVTLRVRKGSATIYQRDVITSLTGTFTHDYNLSINATGNYTVFGQNKQNFSQNGSDTFIIDEPNPTLISNEQIVFPDERFRVRGNGFVGSYDVDLDVLKGSTVINETTITASSSGSFSYYYTVDADESPGWLTFRARLADTRLINASVKVNVSEIVINNTTTTNTSTTNTSTTNTSTTDDDDKKTTTPVYTTKSDEPPVVEPPVVDKPAPLYDDLPELTEEDKGGLGIWWFLIPLLVIILLLGGVIGFTAYEGYLDTSSPQAFWEGIQKALGIDKGATGTIPPLGGKPGFGKPGAAAGPAGTLNTGAFGPSAGMPVKIDPQDAQVIRQFIGSERAKGYDDLTIRNALLKKGWKEQEVDGVFDNLYTRN